MSHADGEQNGLGFRTQPQDASAVLRSAGTTENSDWQEGEDGFGTGALEFSVRASPLDGIRPLRHCGPAGSESVVVVVNPTRPRWWSRPCRTTTIRHTARTWPERRITCAGDTGNLPGR